MAFSSISSLAVLLALLNLSACDRKAARFEEAHEAVRKHLSDPDSAKFDGDIAGIDEKWVCGFVNSKNRMGGYDGRALYVFERGTGAAILPTLPTDNAVMSLFKLKAKPDAYQDQWKKIDLDCFILNSALENCPTLYPEDSHFRKICAAWKKEGGDPMPTLNAYYDSLLSNSPK